MTRLAGRVVADHRARFCWSVVVATMVATGAACQREEESEARLPAPPPEFTVDMREMAFDHPEVAPRGRVLFRIVNEGVVPHRLVMVPLAEDFPPISAQLAGEERRAIEPQAGIPDVEPAGTANFAADLLPGRYAFICLFVDPDGLSHADKGMASEFRVH